MARRHDREPRRAHRHRRIPGRVPEAFRLWNAGHRLRRRGRAARAHGLTPPSVLEPADARRLSIVPGPEAQDERGGLFRPIARLGIRGGAVGKTLAEHFRVDDSGVERHGGHACRQLRGKGLGETLDRPLGRAVGSDLGRHAPAPARTQVHDRAASALDHRRYECPDDVGHAGDVDRKHRRKLIRGNLRSELLPQPELRFTIVPLPRSIIAGTNARMTLATPAMLTESIDANSSAGTFQSGAGLFIRPALFTTTSGAPLAPRTRSTHRPTFTAWVTSTASKLCGSGCVNRRSKIAGPFLPQPATRSEERRVGKECRSRWVSCSL